MTDYSQVKWCSWCRTVKSTCRVVRLIEVGSGPSASVYACSHCREVFRLVPVAEQGRGTV